MEYRYAVSVSILTDELQFKTFKSIHSYNKHSCCHNVTSQENLFQSSESHLNQIRDFKLQTFITQLLLHHLFVFGLVCPTYLVTSNIHDTSKALLSIKRAVEASLIFSMPFKFQGFKNYIPGKKKLCSGDFIFLLLTQNVFTFLSGQTTGRLCLCFN